MSWRGDMAICWRGDMGAREPRGEPPDMGVNVRRALMSATCFSHHWRCASESPVLSCQTVEIEDDMASTRSTTKGGAKDGEQTPIARWSGSQFCSPSAVAVTGTDVCVVSSRISRGEGGVEMRDDFCV
jgi:hypothetical protein